MRFLKAILGAALLIGGLTVTPLAASAASASQSTTLNLTIPTSITMSGLAASYSATTPAGVQTTINTGPLTVNSNNPAGYTLTLAAASANFQGSGSNAFPVGDDLIGNCSSTFSSCSGFTPLSTTPTVVHTFGSAGSDSFGISHAITPPASQAADTYTLSVTYTATAS